MANIVNPSWLPMLLPICQQPQHHWQPIANDVGNANNPNITSITYHITYHITQVTEITSQDNSINSEEDQATVSSLQSSAQETPQ